MISDKIAKKKSKQQQTTFGETSLQNTYLVRCCCCCSCSSRSSSIVPQSSQQQLVIDGFHASASDAQGSAQERKGTKKERKKKTVCITPFPACLPEEMMLALGLCTTNVSAASENARKSSQFCRRIAQLQKKLWYPITNFPHLWKPLPTPPPPPPPPKQFVKSSLSEEITLFLYGFVLLLLPSHLTLPLFSLMWVSFFLLGEC